MGNIEASIQIDMREEAGCSVKTRGRLEETVAALTVGIWTRSTCTGYLMRV